MKIENDTRELNILLVDDDEDDAILFTEALAEIHPHANVKVITEWKQLFSYVESNTIPDIIFLDYILPGKRGNDLAQELKKNEKLKNVPVVLCSGMSEPGKYDEDKNHCIQQTITKPSTFNHLVELLRSVLNSNLVLA